MSKTGESFVCEYCGRELRSSGWLKRHIEKCHSDNLEKHFDFSSLEVFRNDFLSEQDAKYVYDMYPEAKRKSWCPTCDGANPECDHELQVQAFKHYAAAGIGLTYMRIGWEDFFGSEDVMNFCKEYVAKAKSFRENNIGICLLGMNGIGKTTCISLLCKDLLKAKKNVYFTTYQKLVSMLGDTFYDHSAKERYNDKILHSSFLAIDDCGHEFSNRLTQNAIDNVLRERVQASRPTFLTSNMTTQQFFKEYGRSSFSLLVEQSQIFELNENEDKRGKVHDIRIKNAKNEWIHPIV